MMTHKRTQSFSQYLHSAYPIKNSGTVNSYLNAIKILDELFQKKDIFNLNSQPLSEIKDPILIARIIDFIVDEEEKFRNGTPSLFDLGKLTQTSYPRKRFCTAAIKKLGKFVNSTYTEETSK